jgi:hypothetical protein
MNLSSRSLAAGAAPAAEFVFTMDQREPPSYTPKAYRYIYHVCKYPVDMSAIGPQTIESAGATDRVGETNSRVEAEEGVFAGVLRRSLRVTSDLHGRHRAGRTQSHHSDSPHDREGS